MATRMEPMSKILNRIWLKTEPGELANNLENRIKQVLIEEEYWRIFEPTVEVCEMHVRKAMGLVQEVA